VTADAVAGGAMTRVDGSSSAAVEAPPGIAEVRDSARRAWRVEAHRDARGRWLLVSPVRGDNEPFRASADGHRPDSWLAIAAEDWEVLARLCAAPQDERLRREAFRVVDRLVRAAQHALLMGASDDDEEDG
jgi:hypothetical protein